MWRATLTVIEFFAWGLNMLPFLPCQNFDSTVKNGSLNGIAVLDCKTKKYALVILPAKWASGGALAKQSSAFKIFAFWLSNISFQSTTSEVVALRRHPGSWVPPFYLWHGTYSIMLHKILLGLVHLKTSSGIEFNGLWLLLTKWEKYEKNLNLSAPGGPYSPWILGIHCKYLWKSIKHLIIMFLRGWVGTNITSFQVLSCAM